MSFYEYVMQNILNNLSLVSKGNSVAFELLYKRYFAALCSYAHSIIQNQEASQDLVQELFFQMWIKRQNLPTQIPERAFLFKSVHNACLNFIKHKKVENAFVDFEKQQNVIEYYEDFIQEPDEKLERIKSSIELLPPERKRIFIMHRFNDLSYKQIAENLEISVKTVENQIGKALKFIREECKDLRFSVFILSVIFIKKILEMSEGFFN